MFELLEVEVIKRVCVDDRRSYAVVILSSSNINMHRNHLVNPVSQYELSTHLLELAVVLQATAQWWGTIDYNVIIERIFDQYRPVSSHLHFASV